MDYLKYLTDKNLACMIRNEGTIIKEAKGRGIAPLYALYKDGQDYSCCILTDKVIGLAAAHLCSLMRIKKAETNILSRQAYKLLQNNRIEISYNILADYILNNQKTDLCPLEKRFNNNTEHLPPEKIIKDFLKSINVSI